MPSPTANSTATDRTLHSNSGIADHTMRSLYEPQLDDSEHIIDDDREDAAADDDEERMQTRSLPDIITSSADDFEDAIRSLPTTLSLSASSDTTGAASPGAVAPNSWNPYDDEEVTRSIDLVRLNDDTTYFGSGVPVWVSSPYSGQCSNTDADAPLKSKAFGLSLTSNSVISCHLTAADYAKERSDTDSEVEGHDDSREPGAEGSSDECDDGDIHTHAPALPTAATTATAAATAAAATTTQIAAPPSALYTTPTVPDEHTRSYDVSTSTRYTTVSSSAATQIDRRQPVLSRTRSVVLDDDDDSRVFRSIQHASRRSMNEEYTRTRKQIQQRIDRALAQHQISH